jgi:flavin reductase (DIM6/NTAB) family NADH-FMN oxidoreductase RutF
MKKKVGARTLVHPMPAVLVGTYDEDGTANAMTAAWSVTCCMQPPCVGVAVRRERLTFLNIRRTGAFTINVPSTRQAAPVDYLGIVSGKDEKDKLATVGLDVERADRVDAPLLVDCPVCLECRLKDSLEIGTHTWFVGEVLEAHVEESGFDGDGKMDARLIDPLVYSTSDHHYYGIGERVATAFKVGKTLGKGKVS